MSATVPVPTAPDTAPIRRLIRRTRRLLRSSWVVTGLGLTLGLLLGTLAAAALLDLVTPLGTVLRLVALVAVGLPAAVALIAGVVRPLCRRLRPVAVARRIEAHIPGIHSRLVSCLDFSVPQPKQPVSQAFYRKLVREALEKIRGFKARSVIDFPRLRRCVLFALGAGAAFALALLVFADRLPTALARILNPLADIPPASGVVYRVEPGDARVLRGEDIVFRARVEKGSPERLTLELTSPAAEKPLRHDLQKQGKGLWAFTLSGKLPAGFERAFTYRVIGGGTWSKRHTVTLLERPAVVALHTVLHYPAYMDLPPEKRTGPGQAAEVAGPEGGRVEVVARAEGDVRRGEVQILRRETELVPAPSRPERVWFEKELPAGARPGVVWNWDHEPFHGRPHSHQAAPGEGLRNHWFEGAPAGFPVQPGESLFAYVHLDPEHPPKEVMLQWHDGAGWEHRAYWGADRIDLGRPDTEGRRHLGPLPPAGRWVRLEVPAALVGLEGKALHGMGFTVFEGRCRWQRAGSLPPARVERSRLVVVRRFPMRDRGGNVWSGKFPLEGEGLYRVELRNALGYPNQTMKEGKFTALPDNPPQIVLDRPEGDLTLARPGKVRLAMKAFDDYGLKEVAVQFQRGGRGDWTRRVVKRYARPRRDDNDVTATLDLAGMKLVLGDWLRYRVEAVDRKGQVSASSEFTIRLAAGGGAADEQLAAFEKSQDPFEQRLADLIASQARVQEAVEKLTVKYAPLMDRVQAARDKARSRLDPDSARLLDQVRGKLTELAVEKARAKQLGLTAPPPAPNQPPPLDVAGQRLLAQANQKLAELAKERERNARPESGSPPAATNPPPLDAESRQVLKDLEGKLAELARQKAVLARAGKAPLQIKPTEVPKLDRESRQLLKNLRQKLNELDEERDKNVQLGKGPLPKSGATSRPVQLDPQAAREMGALQQELGNVGGRQQQNVQQGEQMSRDLAQSVEQARRLQMLPKRVADQMQAAQRLFERRAVQTMRDLAQAMRQAATANQARPPDRGDLQDMLGRSARLRQDLEAVRKRLQALAAARKNLLSDPGALARLQKDLLRQDAGLSARDLKELRDYLERLRKELERQKGRQQRLKGQTARASDTDLSDLEKKQARFDWDLLGLFAKAKKLQDPAKRLKKRKIRRPRLPYTPEADEETEPPREEDSDEPLPAKKAGKGDAAKAKKKADDEDDDEKKFLPLLGGRKKADPRYAKKQVPLDKRRKKGDDPDDPSGRRQGLEDHQDENLRDIDDAEQSVDSDARTLDAMLDQLEQALRGGRPSRGKNRDLGDASSDAAQQLDRMLQSDLMRQALAAAARLRRMQGQAGAPQQSPDSNNPNLTGNTATGPAAPADLGKLDADTRAVILKMQPRDREELLQGMRDVGPEGYQKYIQEYYKRLTRMKGSR